MARHRESGLDVLEEIFEEFTTISVEADCAE